MASEPKKSRLNVGSVEDLINSVLSDLEIEKFEIGTDDTEFYDRITKRTKMFYQIDTVRMNCRKQAEKFRYSSELFFRIPTWFFRNLAADDPLCQNSNETLKIEIMSLFMLINSISPEMMLAFYIEAGQSIELSLKVHKFLKTMRDIYDKNEEDDYIGLFGTWFTFHCETRTLRRIDMSIVKCGETTRTTVPFIPDNLHWRRQRIVRNLIKNGEYTINDDLDLDEVKRSYQNGLRKWGKFMKKP